MKIRFGVSDGDLPPGMHSPARMVECELRNPSESQLARFPDSKPYYMFKFRQEGGEHDGKTAVRFCTATASQQGHLYQFVRMLEGGKSPHEFLPDAYLDELYAITVSEKSGGKLFVSDARPIESEESIPF